jgi:uncharacterized protein YbjT (DUF2867 family)
LIAVTGATGNLGGRVAAQLSERGVPIRMIVRDPARAPVARGELAEVTDCVERLTGHAPRELPELLERYPESWAHLR